MKRSSLNQQCSTRWVLQAEWPRAIAELTSYPHIEEAAVLSTCNRMELYVVALSRNRVRQDCQLCFSRLGAGQSLGGLRLCFLRVRPLQP